MTKEVIESYKKILEFRENHKLVEVLTKATYVNFPPVYIVVGKQEAYLDSVLEFAKTIKAYGGKVEVLEVEGRKHGFHMLHQWDKKADEVLQTVSNWMSTRRQEYAAAFDGPTQDQHKEMQKLGMDWAEYKLHLEKQKLKE